MSAQIGQNPFCQCELFAGKIVHLAVTGSVACYKAVDIMRAWKKIQIETSITLTGGARRFISPLLFKSLGASRVYGEMFEDEDVFAHLEPGKQADVMVVAPASANALARLAAGIACDMFSTQAVAFSGPLVIAPAMNPRMWNHVATRANINILESRGCLIVPPGIGDTACGDEGQGRLAELPEIFLAALKAMSPDDMAGLNVMVTLGPTREPWDGVRFWSNPSSGIMGGALATCAWLRGANVTAICGPGINLWLPGSITRINTGTASQMFTQAQKLWPRMDMGMFCAAVADFAPDRPKEGDGIKLKKSARPETMQIAFHSNPDILATLAKERGNNQKVLGFAAEITPDMQALLPLANIKLKGKSADIVAANRVNPGDGAFGADKDSMAVVDKNGHEEIWSPQNKADIAWNLCSWLLRI